MVSKVGPIDVEHGVIVHVQELVHDGMFHVFLIEKVSLAKYDCAGIWRKTAGMGEVARDARDVGWCDVYVSLFEMF
jgi:hypothetical protein